MEERLQIVQKMGELTSCIKAMEDSFEVFKEIDTELASSIQINYVIPIDYKYPYGEARTVSKEEKVQFAIPDELREKTVYSIRMLYEESMEKYYQLLDECADKLRSVL